MDLTLLLNVVKATAQAIVPGAGEAIAAGAAVIDYVRSVMPTLNSDDQETLAVALEPLLAKMNRDVDQAVRDLKGN